MCKLFTFIVLIFAFSTARTEPWSEHQEKIQDLERNIYKYEQELDVLVERKKNTRERARIEETLQRIVEIHGELISLRKTMDSQRTHLQAEHPDKAHVLENYDSRSVKVGRANKKYGSNPLSPQLDQLLIKVRLKFSSFMVQDEQKDEAIAVEKVVEAKRKKKREREADVYLRRRSKVKLVK